MIEYEETIVSEELQKPYFNHMELLRHLNGSPTMYTKSRDVSPLGINTTAMP